MEIFMDKQTLELELAWLVKQLPKDLSKYTSTEIRQAYLASTDPNVKDVRIREKEGVYTYTIKTFVKNPQETGYNREETKKLSESEFSKLCEKADKKIRKIRYFYPLQNKLIAEVDFYKDNLEGLNVIEVEFPSISTFKNFKTPHWFGKEVTDSKGIYPPFIADLSLEEVNKINDRYHQKPHQFD